MTRLRFEREPTDSFYRAAKARVDDCFHATGKSRGAGWGFIAKAVAPRVGRPPVAMEAAANRS